MTYQEPGLKMDCREILVEAGKAGGSAVKHKWTEDEKEIVRRDYRGTNASAQMIAVMLGVSFNGVKGQVQKLGVAKNTDRKRWSLEEEEQLRELITVYPTQKIARIMKRSINSVSVRAKRLGLSRRLRDGWFTKKEVCEILGVGHKWLQKRIDSGALKAKPHKQGSIPQKGGGAMWEIKAMDLREFIIKHPMELQGRNVDMVLVVDLLQTNPAQN